MVNSINNGSTMVEVEFSIGSVNTKLLVSNQTSLRYIKMKVVKSEPMSETIKRY